MTNNLLSPIILFVYNRPVHTNKTIEALKKNKLSGNSDLFIFSDGPKKTSDGKAVEAVRQYLKTIDGFKSINIIESTKNKGLANSVISGVTQVIRKHNRVIVLEDDLETSENFLEYMNHALVFYENTKNIWSISGYCPPITIPDNYNKAVFLSYRSSSTGWATWKDRWEKNDWEIKDYERFRKNKYLKKKFNRGGNDLVWMLEYQMNDEIDSWAVRWCYNQFKLDMYSIYPVVSKIRNIGFDGSGTHSNAGQNHKTVIDAGDNRIMFENLDTDEEVLKALSAYYEPKLRGRVAKFLRTAGIYQPTKKILKRFGFV